MILRLSDNFRGLALDPLTVSLVANAVGGSVNKGKEAEAGNAEAGGGTGGTISAGLIGQYAQAIQGFLDAAEKQRLEELLDRLRSNFGFGAINELSNTELLNYAMAFDLEIQRLINEMAPANTPQGRVDRRYKKAFDILNAAVDTVAKARGYKRIGKAGDGPSKYFVIDDGTSSTEPGKPAIQTNKITTAKFGNWAVLGLVGALGYMLLKK